MTTTNAPLWLSIGIQPQSLEQEVLRLIIELGTQFVGAHEGSLLILDEPNKALVFAMTTAEERYAKRLIGQRVPLGVGLTGLAAMTREVQIGAPKFTGVELGETVGGTARETQNVIAAPMLVQDNVVGVLTVVSFDRDKRFTNDDAKAYARLAAVAGVVVEQRRRLNAVEAARKAEFDRAPTTEAERLERSIVSSVTRLTQTSPEALGRVARLMAEIEGLCCPVREA